MTATTFWKQVTWVVHKDLRVEWRGGETLWMATPFAALALLLAPLATGTDTALIRRIGPGMLWLVVILFGMTISLRPGSYDSRPVRDLLALNGLDPAADYLGKSLAGTLLLFGVTVVLTPIMIVLYAPQGNPHWVGLAVLAITGTLGMGLLGTLVGTLVRGLRVRTALGPLLAVPPAVPVLLATSRGTDSALSQGSILTWLLLLIGMDLALIILGVLLAGPLNETTA
ncbi:MAG: ABC transporter permease [Acidimicrobiia bacterium]|nr:ABC transporter permease [Acidimicrobiia bacterium]MYH56150.1 ABC transporter permease [Acidimicrobiia bacterium]